MSDEKTNSFEEIMNRYTGAFSKDYTKSFAMPTDFMSLGPMFYQGMFNYNEQFKSLMQAAFDAFMQTQKEKGLQVSNPDDPNVTKDYINLLKYNMKLSTESTNSAMAASSEYFCKKMRETANAWTNTILQNGQENITDFTKRQHKILEKMLVEYPKAIKEIKSEYGFHFENGGYELISETEHFFLYKIQPTEKDVKIKENGKPILFIHPYVLGPNILAFLPGERKSAVHSFANMGIPTYIRIEKDIATTPAVQTMSGEDDITDTAKFCEIIFKKHKAKATLFGICQGGFFAILAAASGKVDEYVDAVITCVTPIDGTKSKGLSEFLGETPSGFKNLEYATKTLPNGNKVVDGKIMALVFKLKSIENESPIVNFYKDLAMFDRPDGKEVEISKTAAAINHWLLYDRVDVPIEITKISFAAYNTPITNDGTLPITLFGKQLSLKHIEDAGIKVQACYAESDDLVEKESSTSIAKYIDAELTPFPKGHVAIATSWSNPDTPYAYHKRFGDKQQYRGPARFHLDLEEEISKHAAIQNKAVAPQKTKVAQTSKPKRTKSTNSPKKTN